MSLSKQMMLAIGFLFIAIFIATFVITVNNSKEFYQEQLNSNAQDSATSLGLLISNHVKKSDKATMLLMVEALFDRGFFSEISIISIDGKPIVSRHLPAGEFKSPDWFQRMIPLNTATKKALIMKGWHQFGYVRVRSNPNFAYEELWKNTVGLVFLYALMAVVIAFVGLVLIKILFKPLKDVMKQAREISTRKFSVQEKVPRTFELKQVTVAMNQMVLKLKSLFEQQAQEVEALKKQAYQDEITGLGNRRYFVEQTGFFLSDEQDFCSGFLLMFEVGNLTHFNQQYGYDEGNQLLIELSEQFIQRFEENARFCARLNGSCFAALIIGTDLALIEAQLKSFCEYLNTEFSKKKRTLNAYFSLVNYYQNDELSTLLTKGDIALRYAKEKGNYSYHIVLDMSKRVVVSTEQWKENILTAINHQRFHYYQQAVHHGHNLYHREIFMRMLDEQKREIAAGQFFPLAEKYKLGFELDKLALSYLKKLKLETPVAVNLSASSLMESSNFDNILKLLKLFNQEQRFNIALEFCEHLALEHAAVFKERIKQLVDLGFKVGLDRVGKNFISMYQLLDMQLSYLKLDGSFSKAVIDDKSTQIFIKHMIQGMNTLDIVLIATNVENSEQWDTLGQLGIQYGQGWYFSQLLRL